MWRSLKSSFLFCLCWLLVACGTQPVDPFPKRPISRWGEILTLAEAMQADGPQLLKTGEQVYAVWGQAKERNVYHRMRLIYSDELGPWAQLPIPSVYPIDHLLVPSVQEHIHLLWLDVPYDDLEARMRLWSAVITPELLLERGPIRVTREPVFQFTALANGDGSVWIVWSRGLQSEPTLFAQKIDPVGRPGLPETIWQGASWPRLVKTRNHRVYLFWIGQPDDALYRAMFNGPQLMDVTRLDDGIKLERGDHLADFGVALDTTHGYAFWQIVRSSGEVETWVSTGLLGADKWSSPGQLAITVDEDTNFETGFNGGRAFAAALGDKHLEWAAPLRGQFDVVALAVEVEQTLGIVYLRSGAVAGFMPIVETVNLIGKPFLQTDINRHLYLTWAQPTGEGVAQLLLTDTR